MLGYEIMTNCLVDWLDKGFVGLVELVVDWVGCKC